MQTLTGVSATAHNVDELLERNIVLVCKIRNSRIKAKRIAVSEVLCCLYPLQGIFIANGPLSDIRGMISFFVPGEYVDLLPGYLKNLGYCNKFYILDFDNPELKSACDVKSVNSLVWKKRRFSIQPFFKQSEKIYKEQSPHKRHFKILGDENIVKDIYGYRGDGKERGRRALPVEDARCLVNLALPCKIDIMLDPFAGGGGIVYQAKYIDEKIDVISIDIDRILEPGLTFYGAKHYVGDASKLRLSQYTFDAIVTEVPFDLDAVPGICNTLANFNKNLDQHGRAVLMVYQKQSEAIKDFAENLNWQIVMSQKVNRKGTDVVIMICTKSTEMYSFLEPIYELI